VALDKNRRAVRSRPVAVPLVALPALMVLCLAGVGAAADHAAVRPTFRLGDGSAWCRYLAQRRLVACRARRPGPALALARTGEPQFVATKLVPWDASAPVLRGGVTWSRVGVRCRLNNSGVMCANRAGAAIVLGPDGVGALATPLTASKKP
jgi:hypothetical protein